MSLKILTKSWTVNADTNSSLHFQKCQLGPNHKWWALSLEGIVASATRNIPEERKNIQGCQKMKFLDLKSKEQICLRLGTHKT